MRLVSIPISGNAKNAILVSLLFFILCSSMVNVVATNGQLLQVRDLRSIRSTLSAHGPIQINGNDDFVAQGWPGSGTEEEPFLIEGVSIASDRICVNITNTAVHFKIKSCIISAIQSEGYPGLGIFFANVSNGVVEDCDIITDYDGILIFNSEDCGVFDSDVVGYDAGIIVENSNDCNVLNNTVSDYIGDGVHVANSNRTQVAFNSVEGGYDCQEGIVVSGPSWNCTIMNNTIANHYSAGIDLVESVRALVCNNTISLSGTAIVLEQAFFGIVRGNLIGANLFGIHIFSESSNNSIYGNKFEANSQGNAFDSGSSNEWDDGVSIGNWWDDYVGVGVYVIDGEAVSVDRFPEPTTGTVFAEGLLVILILLVVGMITTALFLHRKSKS
jgi:parallel beta-helix repeat protein